MPKVFDWRGYRFYFYSEEGTPLEPPHSMSGKMATRRSSGFALSSAWHTIEVSAESCYDVSRSK